MEAAVYHKYGSVDVVKTGSVSPPEPGPGDVLVRVLVSQITAGDIRIRSSDFPGIFWLPARIVFGLFKPKNPVLGVDFCGVVERSGEGVTGFKPGDRVSIVLKKQRLQDFTHCLSKIMRTNFS